MGQLRLGTSVDKGQRGKVQCVCVWAVCGVLCVCGMCVHILMCDVKCVCMMYMYYVYRSQSELWLARSE